MISKYMQHFYYPNFDPVIFTIGSFSFHWYGLMYVLGFMFAMWLLIDRKFTSNNIILTKKEIEHLLYLNFIGVVVGGRIGYVIFYQWSIFSKNLFYVFKIWEGGMSFHGGLIGVVLSIMWFAHCKNRSFFQISDFVIPAVPFGLGLGRLGNFINGELWGRVTINTPWAMLFHGSISQDLLILKDNPQLQFLFNYYGALPRHPSQLYEMFLEGIVLFIIISVFIYKPRPIGSVSGLFLICYGLFRILVEFFREPDSHIGLISNLITLGQILSIPMILIGIIIMCVSYKKNKYNLKLITNI